MLPATLQMISRPKHKRAVYRRENAEGEFPTSRLMIWKGNREWVSVLTKIQSFQLSSPAPTFQSVHKEHYPASLRRLITEEDDKRESFFLVPLNLSHQASIYASPCQGAPPYFNSQSMNWGGQQIICQAQLKPKVDVSILG